MKVKIENLLISILIPLLLGLIASLLTKNNMQIYNSLNMPGVSLPSYIFPIVWTILYILMGISSYIIFNTNNKSAKSALFIYTLQLFFNFTWSLIFFNLNNYLLSFIWLIILIMLIIIMIYKFYKINPIAAYLEIPYLLWCIFAAYLNYSIYILNK